eukprot:symbB.v1.2.032613.t1/scaffold3934.1/size47971/3
MQWGQLQQFWLHQTALANQAEQMMLNQCHGQMMMPMGTQPFAGFAEQGPTQVNPPSSQNVSSEIPAQDSSGRNSLPEAASPSTTRCKYGRRCTRENCWFLHPEGRSIDNKRKALAEGSEPEASLPKRRPYDVAKSPPKGPLHTPPIDSSPEPAGNNIGKPMPADLHTGVHSRLREVVPEWPRVITPSGKLKDKKLEGQGWPLHFLHPDFPRSVISLEDVQAVVSTLRRQGMGALGTARVSSPGVIQVPLGLQRKGGNLQIYPSATGRLTGNARINSTKEDIIRSARASLLKSAWFSDAGKTSVNPLSALLATVTLSDGKLLLPPLSSSTRDKWLVFLDWCQCEALDFCLLAETGICSTTPLPFSKKWVFDFLPAPKALPGFGVGLLYNSRFQGRCSRVSVSCLSHRFAAWLVSFDKIIVLMGVVYMPHAGRPVEERLDCLNTALRELHDLRSKYPNAWQILAGDFNAPDWLACDDGSGTVASSIRDGMPRDYVVLNCIAGKPQATHKLGNVLDAILTNRAQDVVSFTVGPLLPISDHCPLLATFKVPYSVPRPKGLWCTSRVFSSDAFCKEAQTALCQLYAWIGDECRRDSTEANLFNVLQFGTLLLSVTLLCIVGTDMAFALFHELVLLRRKAILPLETQFIFLDGQAAFCRPPALTVLDALLRVPGLHSQDLCVVHAFLSNLRSRACITGELTRDWRNEAGLSQGGTLSVALFVLLTDAIYQRLVDAKVGLTFPTQHCSCPVLGYVDDLVFCVHSHEAIQDALTQVEHWTQNLRMALNVGRNKSALLMPLCPTESVHQVGSHPLPVVHQYRYLGGVVAHDGSVLPALQDIQSRSIIKTATLMRWCRSQSIPVPLIARLWVLYVESAVMPLLAALPLTNRHLNIYDRMQRKMGRMLLGYQKRSPTPPVLLELAWVPWSVLIPCRRVGLLWRTLEQPHSLMTHLLPHSVSVTGSWGSLAMQNVQAIYGQPNFTPPTGWKTALRKHQDSLTDAARDSFLIQASMHSALLHYPVSVNCRCMLGAVNTPLNRLSSRSLASVICSRLFAGGQGLRGGDRNLDTPPNSKQLLLILPPKIGEICRDFRALSSPLSLTRVFPSRC